MLVGEAPRPSSITLERQLTASFLVSEARFLYCIVSNEQCLCDLTIGLADRLNAAEVAEPTQDDLPFLAPRQSIVRVAPSFLEFEGQAEANVLVDGRAVVASYTQAFRAVHKVTSIRTGAVDVGALARPRPRLF